jgi:protein-S-isoprenylcysteine O-methyltransferase Ste14
MGESRLPILLKAISILVLSSCMAAACLFLAAGTMDYWKAWLCAGEFLVLESGLACYLFIRNPALLDQRMRGREKLGRQRLIISAAYLVIALSVFVVPGLDYRYGWSHLPGWISIAGAGLMIVAFVFESLVVKQNAYLFSTIEVASEQRVVDTGLYSVIRHPMYLFGMIIVLSMPLILDSLCGFLILLPLIVTLFVMRIRGEEKILKDKLAGYSEYTTRVRYRLIPRVW